MNKHDIANIKEKYRQFRFHLRHGVYDNIIAHIIIGGIYVVVILFALWISEG